MRYHLVIYVVPDPHKPEQIPLVDEEWVSSADLETMETAADEFMAENT